MQSINIPFGVGNVWCAVYVCIADANYVPAMSYLVSTIKSSQYNQGLCIFTCVDNIALIVRPTVQWSGLGEFLCVQTNSTLMTCVVNIIFYCVCKTWGCCFLGNCNEFPMVEVLKELKTLKEAVLRVEAKVDVLSHMKQVTKLTLSFQRYSILLHSCFWQANESTLTRSSS